MNVWERKRPRERKSPFAPSQWCGGCSSLLVLLWFPGVFCRASLSCQVSLHLRWLHNFRFQISFQILLAENFHNFFVQIFCIFFPILFPGLVSSGCEGFMVPSFLHCFVSSSPTFWPCLSVRRIWQATDCSSLFLHFFPQVLEVFGTLSCSRILCWRFPPPLVAEDRGTRLRSMEETPETEGRQVVLNSVLLRE